MKIRKEKIIEILDKYAIYRVWFGSDHSIIESRSLTAKEELVDAILAIPLDVPSETELEMQCQQELPIRIACWLQGARWAIQQTIKRNGKD